MSDRLVHVCPQCLAAKQRLRGEASVRVICSACGFLDISPMPSWVDEQSWFTNTSPEHLLGCLAALGVSPSERKRRLPYAAVARTQFAWCRSEWFLHAIEVTERLADGDPAHDRDEFHRLFRTRGARVHSPSRDAELLASDAISPSVLLPLTNFRDDTRRAFAGAVRELFPNPFRPPEWKPDWFTPTARDLAQHIYSTHDFDAMPILADALQDAGCNDEQVLSHCRANGPHARGCWVLGTILGKP